MAPPAGNVVDWMRRETANAVNYANSVRTQSREIRHDDRRRTDPAGTTTHGDLARDQADRPPAPHRPPTERDPPPCDRPRARHVGGRAAPVLAQPAGCGRRCPPAP